ncbi:hypothetical protein EXW28_12605 [Bacillus mycoides]|nr:hypothetical protein EXW37_12600 [Bacillus mycoides]QWH34456.1 hypothetical protein EXW28_12605 [Bacillus mycoides]
MYTRLSHGIIIIPLPIKIAFFVSNNALINLDAFTSIFTKKFMISLTSRVRHYLTITLRSPADNRGSFHLNKDFV